MATQPRVKPPLTLELPDGRTTLAVYAAGRWRTYPPYWGAELVGRRSRQPYIRSDGQRILVRIVRAA